MPVVTELVFAEPPAAVTGLNAARARLGAKLKDRPGEWAIVETEAKGSGPAASWRKLGYEAKAVKDEAGRYTIYARALGEKGTVKTHRPEPAAPPTGASGVSQARTTTPARPAAASKRTSSQGHIPEGMVEVILNGQPTGRFVAKGTNPKEALAARLGAR